MDGDSLLPTLAGKTPARMGYPEKQMPENRAPASAAKIRSLILRVDEILEIYVAALLRGGGVMQFFVSVDGVGVF